MNNSLGLEADVCTFVQYMPSKSEKYFGCVNLHSVMLWMVQFMLVARLENLHIKTQGSKQYKLLCIAFVILVSISRCFGKDKVLKLRKDLHFENEEEQAPDCADRLWQNRPIYDMLRSRIKDTNYIVTPCISNTHSFVNMQAATILHPVLPSACIQPHK